MNIKNIIFDFGGVLMDWSPRYLYEKVFADEKELHYFLTEILPKDWNDQFDEGKPFKEGVEELTLKHPKYKNEIQMYYNRWAEMLKGDIPENSALVEPLSKHYDLYGLTNWSAETFPIAYKNYSFFKIFKGIVVSGEEKLIKPNPEIYEVLLSRYKLKPEESIFIDDNQNNIEMATKLGINTIHYTENMNLKSELIKLGIKY